MRQAFVLTNIIIHDFGETKKQTNAADSCRCYSEFNVFEECNPKTRSQLIIPIINVTDENKPRLQMRQQTPEAKMGECAFC